MFFYQFEHELVFGEDFDGFGIIRTGGGRRFKLPRRRESLADCRHVCGFEITYPEQSFRQTADPRFHLAKKLLKIAFWSNANYPSVPRFGRVSIRVLRKILLSEYFPLELILVPEYCFHVIKSFSDKATEKLFLGQALNKKQRKQERATGSAPEITEGDIARDYFDGFDPNDRTVSAEEEEPEAEESS